MQFLLNLNPPYRPLLPPPPPKKELYLRELSSTYFKKGKKSELKCLAYATAFLEQSSVLTHNSTCINKFITPKVTFVYNFIHKCFIRRFCVYLKNNVFIELHEDSLTNIGHAVKALNTCFQSFSLVYLYTTIAHGLLLAVKHTCICVQNSVSALWQQVFVILFFFFFGNFFFFLEVRSMRIRIRIFACSKHTDIVVSEDCPNQDGSTTM